MSVDPISPNPAAPSPSGQAAPPAAAGAAAPAEKRKYGVLYVDDEETALKYFRRGIEKDCPVWTANSGAAAWPILEKEWPNIGVILSDQKMPGQTGVELLTAARKRWPNMIRILITAYSEIESAIEAVNSGAIYKYLTKPAEPPKLRQILLGALDEFAKIQEKETLLTERLTSLQRLVVADRVRSLAAMADGISHHLRNSMTAMSCFLEESNATGAPQGAPSAGSSEYIDQLWSLARNERSELLTLLQSVAKASSAQPELKCADGVQVAQVLSAATAGALTPAVTGTLPAIKADTEKLAYVFKTLAKYVARLSSPAGAAAADVRVTTEPVAEFWGAPGVRVRFTTTAGAAWGERDVAAMFTPFAFPSNDPSDLGIEMLMAFFIAHRHGGDVIVHRAPPSGPGFELLLPVDPDAVQRPSLEQNLLERCATLQPAA
jgi:two-component system probable response regulator PhcQ